MATLNDYFRTEARDFLNALERSLGRAPAPDATELHRAVRGLRGTAQMAREQRVFDVVSAFESVTRSIAGGALTWSDNVALRARDTIADLRALLDPSEEDEQLDARVSRAAARWREAAPAAQPVAAPPVVDQDTREFREFAAREAAGIADVLDHGISDLQTNAMDRAPLTEILRRQRALLGSARLDEIPVLSDILRAVEDLTRVIVKLDVGVKKEWLDIYRVARDALQTTIAPLLRDELPQPSHSVSRLRHMREELLERYGSNADQPPPPEGPLAPQAVAHPAAPFLGAAGAPVTDAGEMTADDAVLELDEEAASPDEGAMLELDEEAALDDGVLELTDAAAIEDGVLELDEEAELDDGVLELDEAVALDDGVLELEEEATVDGGVLELTDAAAVEDGVLELDEEAALDDGVLELDEEAEFDGGVLDLDAEAELDAGMLELTEEAADDDGVLELDVEVAGGEDAASGMSRSEALDRALALRDVLSRVAAHDPQARRAVDELFDLIRIARG